MHLSTLTREISWTAVGNWERPTTGQGVENKRLAECSAPKENVHHTLSSQGSGIFVVEEWKDCKSRTLWITRKVFSTYNRVWAYLTYMWQHTQDPGKFKPDKSPAWKGDVPLLAKQLLATDSCQERELFDHVPVEGPTSKSASAAHTGLSKFKKKKKGLMGKERDGPGRSWGEWIWSKYTVPDPTTWYIQNGDT